VKSDESVDSYGSDEDLEDEEDEDEDDDEEEDEEDPSSSSVSLEVPTQTDCDDSKPAKKMNHFQALTLLSRIFKKKASKVTM
jgi:hypothetical protein